MTVRVIHGTIGSLWTTGTAAAVVTVGVATLAGFVLRIAWLDSQPLWFDEQQQARAAAGPVLAAVREHAAAAPLDYFGTRLMLTLGLPIRLWPALIGTLTIPLLYLAGRAWFSERVAVIAAVLLAVAPFHVYYSGEARFYALSAFVAVLCLWSYKRGWFAVAVALTLYTHYFAFLVPLALVVLYRDRWRELLIGVALWVPWAVYALPSQIGHRQDIGDLSTVPTAALLAQVLAPDFDVSGLPWILPAIVIAIAIGLAIYGRAWWLLAIVVAVVVLTGVATWRADYFWSPRQVIFVLPLFLLAVAVGWAKLPRMAGIAVLVALVTLQGPFIAGVTGADAWQPRTETLTSP